MAPTSNRLVVVGAVVASVLLLLTAPTPDASVRTLAHAGSATDQTAPLVALLAVLAWLLATWLLVVATVTAGGHLPGAAGRALAVVARRLAPLALRRSLEVALGLTVVVGVLGASPASAAPGPTSAAHVEGAATGPVAAPGLDWGSPAPLAATDHADAPSTGAADAVATPPAQDLDWGAQASTPSIGTAPVPVPADAGPADPAVVVRPGDSLWALAEQDLATRGESTTVAAVAQAWPTWWAANRDLVGDDPDLLQPGTRLAPPEGGSTPPASP